MVFRILEQIANTSSRLEKEAILQANSSNVVLKKAFFLAYDPFTQFYIRKIPDYTPFDLDMDPISLAFALDTLIDLSSRTVTGNAAIAHLKATLEAVHPDDAKVIERVIQKDLACGASASTANKIWPNLIHEYPCMLCSPFEQKLIDKIKFPAVVQLKMDGMRFNAIVKNGKVEFRSRNGKEIQLLGNLEQEFLSLGDNVVFDGELVVKDNSGGLLNRQTGNGILNKAVKGTISAKEAAMIHATIWDAVPYEDFKIGTCNTSYKVRFSNIESMHLGERIHLVESTIVDNIDEARTIFQRYLDQGQEGIILKDLNGKWEDKRVKHQIKFKAELDCDLEIIGYEEGTGKYVGKLGALVCGSRSTDSNRVVVSVGSGFDDESRDYLWSVRDTLVGKIVSVKYNARLVNKQGEHSLFLPVFLEVREDKTVADSEKKIK